MMSTGLSTSKKSITKFAQEGLQPMIYNSGSLFQCQLTNASPFQSTKIVLMSPCKNNLTVSLTEELSEY